MISIEDEILVHGREGSGVLDRLGGRVGEAIQDVVVRRWGWSAWRQGDWAMALGSHAIQKFEEKNRFRMRTLQSHALDWLAQRLETSCTEWVSGDLCPFNDFSQGYPPGPNFPTS